MTKETKQKNKKIKKDRSKKVLIALFILVILEVIMIPLLVYSRIVKIFPVIAFLIIPTLLAIFILLLCRNAIKDFNNKKEKIIGITQK